MTVADLGPRSQGTRGKPHPSMSCANCSPIIFNKPGAWSAPRGTPLGNAHLSLFLTDRFCSTPSIKFLKHWARISCLGRGWLFIRLALSSLKYCWETEQCQAQGPTPNLAGRRSRRPGQLGSTWAHRCSGVCNQVHPDFLSIEKTQAPEVHGVPRWSASTPPPCS